MNSEASQYPAPFERNTPGQNFFMVMVMYFVGFALANGIGILCLMFIAHKNLIQLTTLDYSEHNVVVALDVGQIVGAIITFIVPAFLFSRLASNKPADYLNINKGNSLTMFLLAGAVMILATPLINFLAELNSHVPFPDFIKKLQDAADKEQEAFLKDQSIGSLVTNILMIGLLAALGEELFFRAVLQKVMIQLFKNVHVGVWMTGILFSFMHLEFYGFVPRMLMGVYLGYLFVWSGSLWVPVFAHFLNNSIAVFLIFLENRKILPDKVDQVGSDSSQLLYVVISTAVVGLLLYYIYKLRRVSTETLA